MGKISAQRCERGGQRGGNGGRVHTKTTRHGWHTKTPDSIAARRLGVRGYRDTVFQTGYRAILKDLPLITTTNTPDLGRLTSSLVDFVVADFKVMNNFFYYTIRKDKECFLNHLIPPIVFFIIFAQK
ncbi:MAG: hypothetical protein PUC50_15200 [Bacteroidales bacterium]|nr:hypothetical protein [Bacteroidales bacterium]